MSANGPGPVGSATDATSSLAQLISAYRSGSRAIGRLRTRIRQDRNVSAGYLGLSFVLLGAILLVRGLASLAWSWSDAPWRWLSLLAWAVLIAAFLFGVITARRSGGILPARTSYLLTFAGVLAVVADFAAFGLDESAAPLYPTATIGFGAGLLACLPLQPLRRSVVAAGCLTGSGIVALAAGFLLDPASLSAGVTGLLLGLTPVAAGISMIHASDIHLWRTIEQAVTDSLVTAPALGHGIVATAEIRRLDGDAEQLLASVSRSPAEQPIDPTTSALAELLSDELRLALLADHEQSWLQIAVTESEHLSRTVTVVDPAVLATHLNPAQRKDLLALTWLCVAAANSPALDLTFVRSHDGQPVAAAPTIVFSLTGTRRRGIDPAVWPLFSRLGRHTVDLGADRALVVVDVI